MMNRLLLCEGIVLNDELLKIIVRGVVGHFEIAVRYLVLWPKRNPKRFG